MKDIMKVVFIENNFKIMDLPNNHDTDSFFAISLDNQKTNYYLVAFLNDTKEILNREYNFNEFYESVMELEGDKYDPQMDKNLSMLICVKRDTLSPNEEISKAIYQIEEDPYFFKKYILAYTDEEIKLIHEESKTSSSGLSLELLYDVLYNHNKFLSFKSNPYLESTYNLVSKLFIKIPFLNLKDSDQEIENLAGNINSSLDITQINLRNKSLESIDYLTTKSGNLRESIMNFLEVDKDGEL